MSSSLETNKYIEKLVRIITQKEKAIDELRRSAKMSMKQNNNMIDDQTSIVGLKVRQDLTTNHLQIKSLQEKMSDMERKLFDFSQELKEQCQINEQLRLQILSYEKRQKESHEKIAISKDLTQNLEKKITELEIELSKELEKRGILELEKKELTKKLQGYKITKECEIKQAEQQLKMIEGKVKNLYRIVNEILYTQSKQQEYVLQNQKQDIIKMIEIIEQKLKKEIEYPRQDVLNDTLDGISMIVKSLECGYSKAESQKLKNCSYGPAAITKNEASFLQTARQSKFQCLKKSKLQSTRLNCTTKILQDFLSQ